MDAGSPQWQCSPVWLMYSHSEIFIQFIYRFSLKLTWQCCSLICGLSLVVLSGPSLKSPILRVIRTRVLIYGQAGVSFQYFTYKSKSGSKYLFEMCKLSFCILSWQRLPVWAVYLHMKCKDPWFSLEQKPESGHSQMKSEHRARAAVTSLIS